jgi:hypothetical protein
MIVHLNGLNRKEATGKVDRRCAHQDGDVLDMIAVGRGLDDFRDLGAGA